MMTDDQNKRPLFIFCGGNSRRMGRDKALLMIGEETFLDHIANRAVERFGSVGLLSNGRAYGSGLASYPDSKKAAGPLGGLLTAMKVSTHPVFATVTVDAPTISDRLLQILANRPLTETVDAAIIKSNSTGYPLSGIFHIRCLDRLEKQLCKNRYRVLEFIHTLTLETIHCDEHEMGNINSAAEYRSIRGANQ